MNLSLTKKMFALVTLTLLMWIPLLMIENTVSERANRRDSVQQEVAASLAGEQRLFGPLLVVPYTYLAREKVTVGKGKDAHEEERLVKYADNLQIIPKTLNINTTLNPLVLERGIFKAITYQSETVLEGQFTFPERMPANTRDAQWEPATVSIGLGDVRGLSTTPEIEWNTAPVSFEPGSSTPLYEKGVTATVGLLDHTTTYHFRITLSLRGSKSFYVAPIAQQFEFNVNSIWPHPNFNGNFLPENREVSDTGFKAHWRLTDFATHARQLEYCPDTLQCQRYIEEDHFGVSLIDPVDNYLQAERAVKYGFLFIILTFSAVFLTETLRKQNVHPIQYLLTGVALAMFFLLVLAFSEHMGFRQAYGLASAACVGLIGFYLSFALSHRIAGISAGGLLAALYFVMYQLLQSEDSALLLGSSLLFGLLAFSMVITRRVNWYDLTSKTLNVNLSMNKTS